MASEVTICNLALGHIGDSANVVSIDPPDASIQAQHCARFYPIARNSLLEMGAWGFATRRISLAAVDNPSTTWLYAYAMPAAVINLLAVLPAQAIDDYEVTFGAPPFCNPPGYMPIAPPNEYTPQPYTVETDSAGNQIILTNTPDAVLRYTTVITDANQFSPLFTLALSWLLASMLAGPIIKGEAGSAKATECLKAFAVFEAQAEASDASQRRVPVTPVVSWIAGR